MPNLTETLPKPSSWSNSMGNGLPEQNTKADWKNSGAISWNTKDSSYEDTSGAKYQINDDGATFDDGTGKNFNPDGSPAKVSSTSTSIFGSILGIFTNPVNQSKILELAIAKINADTNLSAQAKAEQIAIVNGNVKTSNAWVTPTLVVGVILAAGISYYYFVKKKK